MAAGASDDHPPPGAVELREDVPLTAPAAARRCAGPRLIAAAFAALSLAITLALLTQIYCGDYEVVPHGSVSSSVGACSEGGARLLRAGGGALDAAAATALCQAVAPAADPLALDASGSLLYWDYRREHAGAPTLAEWGEGGGGVRAGAGESAPQLLVALAALHVQYGLLPWSRVLQPAIDLAESKGAGGEVTGLLRSMLHNSSAELCAAWVCAGRVRVGRAAPVLAGAWRAYSGGVSAAVGGGRGPAEAALRSALLGDDAGVAAWLQRGGAGDVAAGSGLAVVDPRGAYVALVTGPGAPADLAPAIIVDEHICGTRYVVGAGSRGALVQAAGALARGEPPARALEAPRSAARAGHAPVNLVRQRADALLAHADSRAGGLAARF